MVDNFLKTLMGMLICVAFLLSGCKSAPEPEPTPEPEPEPVVEKEEPPPKKEKPDWADEPPKEEGAIHGIGNDEDEDMAEMESLVDLAWQAAIQAYLVILEDNLDDLLLKENLARKLGKQMVKAVLFGAEVANYYKSDDGQIWILTRKVTPWVLDVLESVIIFYSEQLGYELDAFAVVTQVEKKFISERITNPGIENPDDIPGVLGDIAAKRIPLPGPKMSSSIKQ